MRCTICNKEFWSNAKTCVVCWKIICGDCHNGEIQCNDCKEKSEYAKTQDEIIIFHHENEDEEQI